MGLTKNMLWLSAYGSTSARSYPVSLVYTGYYSWNTSNLANQTAAGYYESLLANPNNTKYYFLLRLGANVNYILPQFIDGKDVGFSLRYPYGSTSARSYPVSLVYSGIYSWIGGGYLDYQNEWAFIYTSATLIYNNKELGQDLLISTNVVNPWAGNDKRVGHALRWL